MPASEPVPDSEVEASVEVPEAPLLSPPAWLPSPALLPPPQEEKVNEAAARAMNNTFFISLFWLVRVRFGEQICYSVEQPNDLLLIQPFNGR
jgi:hypothetical protein